jgi:methylmalonyl-CoA mutase N-terminal domain/subunit
MDEALWLPTERSVRVALRTQQVIANESGVADTIDPLAGSYLIEYLTDEIEQRAREYIQKIDQMGGALKAIELGYIQGEIQDSAYRTQQAIEKEEQLIVGVNSYQSNEKITLERLRVDPAIEQTQRSRLSDLRSQRDAGRVSTLLNQLELTAKGNQNLMPLFIESVENDITLGEICTVLRRVFGEYHPPAWV